MKQIASDDFVDLRIKFKDNVNAYDLMKAEFESSGDLEGHTFVSEPNKGKQTYKQAWKHKHTGYEFV